MSKDVTCCCSSGTFLYGNRHVVSVLSASHPLVVSCFVDFGGSEGADILLAWLLPCGDEVEVGDIGTDCIESVNTQFWAKAVSLT